MSLFLKISPFCPSALLKSIDLILTCHTGGVGGSPPPLLQIGAPFAFLSALTSTFVDSLALLRDERTASTDRRALYWRPLSPVNLAAV